MVGVGACTLHADSLTAAVATACLPAYRPAPFMQTHSLLLLLLPTDLYLSHRLTHSLLLPATARRLSPGQQPSCRPTHSLLLLPLPATAHRPVLRAQTPSSCATALTPYSRRTSKRPWRSTPRRKGGREACLRSCSGHAGELRSGGGGGGEQDNGGRGGAQLTAYTSSCEPPLPCTAAVSTLQ